ncbi:MAG TPA: carbamate kinase [Jatrophihabitans sp.]|nr:carbamate kinase [Jatrophihabitans sp.]
MAALGGNALLERGETPDAAIQRRHVRRAARALVPLAANHELLICHGNGPQIGILAVESEADETLSQPFPLDALGAQTQGLIGYWLSQELRNAGVARPIATILTQTLVDAGDPAFDNPTKFIGPVYKSHHHAERLAREFGWTVAQDGRYWRRVVPSPQPLGLIELPTIRLLLQARVVTVCTGGGGVPVTENESGELSGAEAVVDKDLAAARLACDLRADALLLLTDVPAVMRDFGSTVASPIKCIDTAELKKMSFPAGSMGPKVEACVRFVETTGGTAAIGALGDATALLDGTAGTLVLPDPARAERPRQTVGIR